MSQRPQRPRSILHRTPLVAAAGIAAALAGSDRALALPSVDSLLEELVEDRIEQQVESRVLEAVERALEADLEGSLESVGTLASQALRGVTEVLPTRVEQFRPDVDPEGHAVERGAWLVLAAPEHVARLEQQGFAVRELRRLDALGRALIRIDAPADGEPLEAARRLALEAPGTQIDFNHLYRGVAGGAGADARAFPAVARVGQGVTIGIVDTAVAVRHEALRRAAIEQRDFVSYEGRRSIAHGTAVASILVGDSPSLHGALRGARLRAASVFFEDHTGDAVATTASLVMALDWLARSGVRVVSMSLAGPPNRVLEAAIQGIAGKGIVVVAAVGNDGPTAEPRYPAAYAPVVAVTAIDSEDHVYPRAGRGPHVTFAAPGVGIRVARADGGYGDESGTSMAAPQAAAILTRALCVPGATPARVLSAAKSTAIDLGEPGFDETFGYGRIAPGE